MRIYQVVDGLSLKEDVPYPDAIILHQASSLGQTSGIYFLLDDLQNYESVDDFWESKQELIKKCYEIINSCQKIPLERQKNENELKRP